MSRRYLNMGEGVRATMEQNEVTKCPECSSRDIDVNLSKGERYCIDCGLVIEENLIDPGVDWKHHGDGINESERAGPPASVMFHDKGLSTEIEWSNRDYAGKQISSKSRSQMYRMRKWQKRARISSSFERNMANALSEISRLASSMGLSKAIREETAVIYRRALEKDLIRGRSIDAMVAASMYLANQKLRTARSLDDFVNATRVNRKAITRAHKIVKHALGVRTEPAQPEEYLARYTSMLGMPNLVIREATSLIQEARELELTHGKSPTGVAAAAVYIAGRRCNSIRTQREIADVSGVTEVTIRNRYKELCTSLNIELN